MRRALLLLAPLTLAALPGPAERLFGAGPAAAQFATQPRPATGAAQPPPPPALPGLAGRRAPEPIPGDPEARANMSPTAALFDAITRGDLAAARDAVNRGADLNGRNVLGLTPVDAAVDQGRNEILFYLLSARGPSSGAGAPADANLTPQQRAARDRAAATAAAAASRENQRALREARREPRVPAEPLAPRKFAGDGGTPQPDIGFIGFDAGRPAGAAAPERVAARRGR